MIYEIYDAVQGVEEKSLMKTSMRAVLLQDGEAKQASTGLGCKVQWWINYFDGNIALEVVVYFEKVKTN